MIKKSKRKMISTIFKTLFLLYFVLLLVSCNNSTGVPVNNQPSDSLGFMYRPILNDSIKNKFYLDTLFNVIDCNADSIDFEKITSSQIAEIKNVIKNALPIIEDRISYLKKNQATREKALLLTGYYNSLKQVDSSCLYFVIAENGLIANTADKYNVNGDANNKSKCYSYYEIKRIRELIFATLNEVDDNFFH